MSAALADPAAASPAAAARAQRIAVRISKPPVPHRNPNRHPALPLYLASHSHRRSGTRSPLSAFGCALAVLPPFVAGTSAGKLFDRELHHMRGIPLTGLNYPACTACGVWREAIATIRNASTVASGISASA